MYRETHKNQVIKDLFSSLNYLRKLTSQLEYLQGSIAGDGTTRIAYAKNGEPTAAIIRDNHAILDNAMFGTVCASMNEAHYVLAIINSNQLASQAKPFCTTNWAKKIRDFHKHGWKLANPTLRPQQSAARPPERTGQSCRARMRHPRRQ